MTLWHYVDLFGGLGYQAVDVEITDMFVNCFDPAIETAISQEPEGHKQL